ncbi:MAG: hypothetical protein ACRDHL_08165 [Candidatus Promineifilaceae bacterium]
MAFGLALTLLEVLSDPAGFQLPDPAAFHVPVFLIVATAFLVTTLGLYAYRTMHQLRLVNRLHRQATRINLLQPAPIHAFSALTARTGGGLILFSLYLVALNATQGLDAGSIGAIVLTVLLGGASFILPLLGMHERLVAEKGRLLAEANRRLEAIFAELYGRVDADDLESMAEVNDAMASLVLGRDLLAKLSTWPWQAGTLRGFISAAVLPILLWLAIATLERVFGF